MDSMNEKISFIKINCPGGILPEWLDDDDMLMIRDDIKFWECCSLVGLINYIEKFFRESNSISLPFGAIDEVRKISGLTMYQAENLLNVTEQTLINWKNAAVYPNKRNTYRICFFYETKPDIFHKLDNSKVRNEPNGKSYRGCFKTEGSGLVRFYQKLQK